MATHGPFIHLLTPRERKTTRRCALSPVPSTSQGYGPAACASWMNRLIKSTSQLGPTGSCQLHPSRPPQHSGSARASCGGAWLIGAAGTGRQASLVLVSAGTWLFDSFPMPGKHVSNRPQRLYEACTTLPLPYGSKKSHTYIKRESERKWRVAWVGPPWGRSLGGAAE